ncbi:hydroxyacid oxidase 1-like [Homarus americanus]|uniref:(S)-2-hydroxy-acid oxidase n=1 Tax=Homarus americanus TaxID=6706 RepID=A0A8J5JVZ7_HOMAM|nr:hydroxyacid oxidase 1-like [Homarus americanus]KAG7164937.1 Hydroxyacid oxidase 1-like [Homarus americanus]
MKSSLVCVSDYEAEAHKSLPRNALDYYRSGAMQETTLHENKEAISRWYIRPRFLRDMSIRSLATTILGHRVKVPYGIAPTAMQRMAHPDGEVANARAAGRIGTAFTLSTIATASVEEIAEHASDTLRFFQLYIFKDREVTANLVHRAEAAGFSALVLTVDAPHFGIRRADIRNKFALPPNLRMANFQTDDEKSSLLNTSAGGSGITEYVKSLFDPSLSWDDVAWLTRITKMPIVLKGILTAEDAILGIEAGAAGIWVSNHGARQIDGVPPTIEALPEVVKAVKGQCEVYIDGGFSQGNDIFKALALGAQMVFLGRPMLWGLACGGEEGAYSVLDILKTELDSVMALSGCATIKDITKEMVIRKEYYARL